MTPRPYVGLFGTCGGSRWREPFASRYNDLGIPYFNPQVQEWTADLAEVEAEHLAEDPLILFAVTPETYGTGSLAECGFSILQAVRLDDRRDFVVWIAQSLAPELQEDPTMARESLRARALVTQHLRKLNLSSVYVVGGLDEMLDVSLRLYEAVEVRASLRHLNPQNYRKAVA
jgi:hypothetical protein